jgi:hypothetical protein
MMAEVTARPTVERKSFDNADEVRTFPSGKLEVVTFVDQSLGRATLEPGWRWSECIKPVVGTESCEAGHFGHIISGNMHVVGDDGSEADYGPGDVLRIAPGHDAWVVGSEPCVMFDFTAAATYAKPQ